MPNQPPSEFTPPAFSPLFDWLRAGDPLPAHADVVIGFGHFDLRIPRLCGSLLQSGVADKVIFTGGIGAGTGDLGGPEALVFDRELRTLHPRIPNEQILLESRSTNTGDNLAFTLAAAEARGRGWRFGTDLRTAILVAHPARLKRVRHTWLKRVPGVTAFAIAPETTFEIDAQLHAAQGGSLSAQVLGELERLHNYPAKGWMTAVEIPEAFRGFLP